MSKVFTIMLRKHGETTGLMLYQAKAKNYEAAVLLMKIQGVVPSYDILSHTERPAREFLTGIIFPRTIKSATGEAVSDGSGWRQYFRPIICWAKRQHQLVKYRDFGEYCKRCKGVFPNERDTKENS